LRPARGSRLVFFLIHFLHSTTKVWHRENTTSNHQQSRERADTFISRLFHPDHARDACNLIPRAFANQGRDKMAATATTASTLRQSPVQLKHYTYLVSPFPYGRNHSTNQLLSRQGVGFAIGHVHLSGYPGTFENAHHTPDSGDAVWLLGRCMPSITYLHCIGSSSFTFSLLMLVPKPKCKSLLGDQTS
jgi:hypothetical protein